MAALPIEDDASYDYKLMKACGNRFVLTDCLHVSQPSFLQAITVAMQVMDARQDADATCTDVVITQRHVRTKLSLVIPGLYVRNTKNKFTFSKRPWHHVSCCILTFACNLTEKARGCLLFAPAVETACLRQAIEV